MRRACGKLLRCRGRRRAVARSAQDGFSIARRKTLGLLSAGRLHFLDGEPGTLADVRVLVPQRLGQGRERLVFIRNGTHPRDRPARLDPVLGCIYTSRNEIFLPRESVPEMVGGCTAARLRVLNRMVTKLYDDDLRPHGLRVSQMNILVATAAYGPLPGVDVARSLWLDASTLSRDLDRMIARGWVTAAAGVGRAESLEVTAAGRALLAATAPAWRKA